MSDFVSMHLGELIDSIALEKPEKVYNKYLQIKGWINSLQKRINELEKETSFSRSILRKIVDESWRAATESSQVPSTKWADKIIDKVLQEESVVK